MLRSPTKFQIFHSLQSNYGKYPNVGGKAVKRELRDGKDKH